MSDHKPQLRPKTIKNVSMHLLYLNNGLTEPMDRYMISTKLVLALRCSKRRTSEVTRCGNPVKINTNQIINTSNKL